MNKGIAMASGNIISFLNADDFYEPGVLVYVSQLFSSLKEPTFLYGNCNVINEDEQIKYINKPKNLNIVNLLLKKCEHPYNPSAYFYHKSLHDIVGLYGISDHYAMDLDFIFRAIQAANLQYIDETLGNYRDIQGTKTQNSKSSGLHEERKIALFQRYYSQLPITRKLQVEVYKGYRQLRAVMKQSLFG
jgi:glycosyltransferase involved in cell wall biosynthesis